MRAAPRHARRQHVLLGHLAQQLAERSCHVGLCETRRVGQARGLRLQRRRYGVIALHLREPRLPGPLRLTLAAAAPQQRQQAVLRHPATGCPTQRRAQQCVVLQPQPFYGGVASDESGAHGGPARKGDVGQSVLRDLRPTRRAHARGRLRLALCCA